MRHIRGVITCLLVLINTLIGIGPLLIMALIKLMAPKGPWRDRASRAVAWVAEHWAEMNKMIFALMTPTDWDIRSDVPLERDHSYLVISNHQSWVDIPALLQAFNLKTPYFKFFLKKELIWIPFLGLAFWALDYPFMKRYSKAHLAKHPEDKGKDLEITRHACAKFKSIPVTVVNYLEGTRFTEEKHARQHSPYQHLLRPKSGGIAFVMAALGEKMSAMLDVTIVYPDGQVPGFWDLVTGQVDKVVVDIRAHEVPAHLFHGDYANDPQFQAEFQAWVSGLWQAKDARIAQLKGELAASA